MRRRHRIALLLCAASLLTASARPRPLVAGETDEISFTLSSQAVHADSILPAPLLSRAPLRIKMEQDTTEPQGAQEYMDAIRAMGIRDHPTAPHSPWQNGHVERLIGSIRREGLDHLIVFDEAHLRRVLKNYASYYNQVRPHLSLHKNAPDPRRPQKLGPIAAISILGGLHHQYVRV